MSSVSGVVLTLVRTMMSFTCVPGAPRMCRTSFSKSVSLIGLPVDRDDAIAALHTRLLAPANLRCGVSTTMASSLYLDLDADAANLPLSASCCS